MNTPVITVLEEKGYTVHQTRPEATVREAVACMNENHIGALLVMSDGKPVGMFTERDVLTRVVAPGLDPRLTSIESVMSPRLTIIRHETAVEDALAIMTRERHRHLPVIDADDRLVGMVSIGDLTRWTLRDGESYIQNLSEYIWGAITL